MKHSIKDKTTGRFIKGITVNETKSVKPAPVFWISFVLSVIGVILMALDKAGTIDLLSWFK